MKQILIQAAGHALFAAALFATSSTALAQSAQDFVNEVAISDMFEIQSRSSLRFRSRRTRTRSHLRRKWSRTTRRHPAN